MISFFRDKYKFIAMITMAMFLAVMVGCAQQGTMTKDEEMSKDNSGTTQREGSGTYP
jgi:hypothetical protein